MSALMNIKRNGRHRDASLAHRNWSNWIDDFFGSEALPSTFANTSGTLPKVNISETEDNYFVDLAIPGLKKSDFNIDLDNEVLTISAEVKTGEKNENYTRREFGYTSFKRTFTLPDTIDDSKIKANYEDGILSITLPKREEAKPKPSRVIEIS